VSTGSAVLAEVGFFWGGGGPRSLAESSRGWVPIQMVFYILPPFIGGGGVSVDYRGVGPLPVNIWERADSPYLTL